MWPLRPSKKRRRSPSVGAAALFLSVALASADAAVAAQAAQAPAAPASLSTHISNLASIDYATRMNAARMVRRAPVADAVAALTEAVRSHADQFVRYRALIVLTSFNDRATGDLMRGLLGDKNDRVREVAYKWFEANPDGRLTDTLLAALKTEQAEFVRPALIGALAALGSDSGVQRALVPEISRGLDFFRSAVVDALGRHKATYAIDAIAGLAVLEGPLQDDAVLALGRIGGARASASLKGIQKVTDDVVPTVRAAQCLVGEGCDTSIKGFVQLATQTGTAPAVVRASIAALGAVAASGNRPATDALVSVGARGGGVRAQAALALAAAAVRSPGHVLAWLDAATATMRDPAIELLKEGFEDLEEDFGEEMFFATTRATYWKAGEGSETRTLTAALIQKLEF